LAALEPSVESNARAECAGCSWYGAKQKSLLQALSLFGALLCCVLHLHLLRSSPDYCIYTNTNKLCQALLHCMLMLAVFPDRCYE
jgi:hypothetical protein